MSMTGMMNTILNLGFNTETLKGLIAQTGDERFGYDSYRRFIQLFGKVALDISGSVVGVGNAMSKLSLLQERL
jgi:pyruvate,orthophosphate dikinase